MVAQLRWLVTVLLPLFFFGKKRDYVSWPRLDLQNLLFLGFADLVHLIDEAIGELL